jgi:DNA repair ATPase RecN
MTNYTLAELLSDCTPENRHEEVFVDERQASTQVIDMLANLARRVTSLERQLAATQRNLETFAEQTEDNSEDIRELDSRSQVLNAINKYYAEGSR